ncbi:hypothetical protein L9F63_027300, partial [Diploptera punctata]
VVAHTWEITQQARKPDGILESKIEQLTITLNADSSDSSDEAEVDIYEDCGIFPLDQQ